MIYNLSFLEKVLDYIFVGDLISIFQYLREEYHPNLLQLEIFLEKKADKKFDNDDFCYTSIQFPIKNN